MPILLTPIARLSPDHTPVTIRATIRAIRPGHVARMLNEGVLKDETGEVAFTVWEDSGIRDLAPGRQYIFHRADIGRRDGRLEVRLQAGALAALAAREVDIPRILYRLSREEQAFRGRIGRQGRTARWHLSRKNVYSILITSGIALWITVMALMYTGVLSEKKIKEFFQARKTLALKKSLSYPRQGKVTEALDQKTINVEVGGEILRLRYLGLDFPSARGQGQADPLGRRALGYQKYLLVGKEVRLEFEETLPPEKGKGLAYVFLGQMMVNADLLEKGYARLLPGAEKLEHAKELKQAEESARSARIGVWAVNNK